ncbi:MAG: GPP34 family phosphoprotein [Gemmatimonadota bacterium]|jgi:hypothetical protein
MADHELTLAQEIALLSLRDEEGTHAASMWQYAMGGAVLAELVLLQRVAPVERKRGKPLLEASHAGRLGDPALDHALSMVRDAKRRAPLASWVSRFANNRELRDAVVRGLVHKGILRADEKQILFFFRRRSYPEVDPAPERAVIERLRTAIFGDDPVVDPRTTTLVALAAPAGLLRVVFDRKELKRRKDRLEALTEGALLGDATKEAIQAAVVAATTAASVAATAAT